MILAVLNASMVPMHRDERGVLLQADEVVEQRRDDPAHRLRDDDVAHASATSDRPSDRAAALWLQWMLSMPARYTSATYAP